MLRNLVLAFAWLLLAAAIFGALVEPGMWPAVLMAALVVLGTVYERHHYRGGEDAAPSGGSWQATNERFRDEGSGRLVTVWFNSMTGERRYVDAGETPPVG